MIMPSIVNIIRQTTCTEYMYLPKRDATLEKLAQLLQKEGLFSTICTR